MGILEKISEIEKEIARTQKNKGAGGARSRGKRWSRLWKRSGWAGRWALFMGRPVPACPLRSPARPRGGSRAAGCTGLEFGCLNSRQGRAAAGHPHSALLLLRAECWRGELIETAIPCYKLLLNELPYSLCRV